MILPLIISMGHLSSFVLMAIYNLIHVVMTILHNSINDDTFPSFFMVANINFTQVLMTITLDGNEKNVIAENLS